MTGSDLTINNVSIKDLGLIPDSFRKLGIKLEVNGDDIHIPSQDRFKIESYIDGSIMTIADSGWRPSLPKRNSLTSRRYSII